jgi:hypothetical protein
VITLRSKASTIVATGVIALGLTSGSFALLDTRAVAGDDGEALLERSRRAATQAAFEGVVEVKWRDDTGTLHTERVGARSLNGSFVIGRSGHQMAGSGTRRWTDEAGELRERWREGSGTRAPRAGAHWDLSVSGHAFVAGRTGTVVDARDRDGVVRAQFVVDREHGQLLQRQVFDRSGRIVRSVGFVTIVFDAVSPGVVAEPPGSPDTPVAIAHTPDGFIAPAVVGDGYRLLGRYRHPNGEVQLFYSDGLFTMSLFEQRGRVDWDSLPAGRSANVAGMRTRGYGTAAGNVVVWAAPADHLVLTAVGDGPSEALDAVVADLSGGSGGDDWVGDVARYVLGPFGWE